jgi:hypothetical protein
MDNAKTGGGAANVAYSPRHRTRQTNDLFCTPGIDGRSWEARAYRDCIRGLLADLGIEDQSELSSAAKIQLRAAAKLSAQIEIEQNKALKGEPVDQLGLIRQQGLLSRMLWGLGLTKRKRQNLGPTGLAQTLEAVE